MKRLLHFLIPDPEAFPSGGNIYNAKLINALKEMGIPIACSHDFENFNPSIAKQIIFVDSLFLDRFSPQDISAPVILISHHLASMDENLQKEKQRQLEKEKQQLQYFNGFLSTSTFTSNYLKLKLDLNQPVLTIPPALASSVEFEKTDFDQRSTSVLMVGNVIQRKGVLPFLKEWSTYSWPMDFHLQIIGDVNLEPDYARQCIHFWEALPQDQKRQISFTGALEQEEVFKKYKTAGALVSASTMETFGMAMQEAIAYALPLLVLDGGYSKTHVADGNGAVFKNLKELVKALKKWGEDPVLRLSYAQSAQIKAKVKTANWTDAANRFLQNLNTHFSISENAFDTTWLNTRFPFDEAARNLKVKQAVNELFKSKIKTSDNPLRLLDIGAGTGANFLHFFERIHKAQKWIFLDHDPRLLLASLERIKKVASEKGYQTEQRDATLQLTLPAGNISIQTICGSFEQLEKLVDLSGLDLAMASAFFDLFSAQKLETFLEKIKNAKAPLLLTLNYSGMNFTPLNQLDEKVVQWYEDHMQRPQSEGQAMGPGCSTLIQQYLQNNAAEFVTGMSIWDIKAINQSMSRFLLRFMEESIGNIDLAENDREQFGFWMTERKQQLTKQELCMKVEHFDFFVKEF